MAFDLAHVHDLRRRLDQDSWAEIAEWYERYEVPLLAYLARMMHSVHDAGDIVQEAFIHLWLARSSGPIYNPKAFLFTTAQNLVKDNCRLAHTHAMRAAVPLEDVDIPDLSEPSHVVESDQALALIITTLEQLRPSTQQAFFLDRIELYSHAQIAARMGVTVSMVEKHIRYAMNALEHSGFEQPRHASGRPTKVGPRKRRRALSRRPADLLDGTIDALRRNRLKRVSRSSLAGRGNNELGGG